MIQNDSCPLQLFKLWPDPPCSTRNWKMLSNEMGPMTPTHSVIRRVIQTWRGCYYTHLYCFYPLFVDHASSRFTWLPLYWFVSLEFFQYHSFIGCLYGISGGSYPEICYWLRPILAPFILSILSDCCCTRSSADLPSWLHSVYNEISFCPFTSAESPSLATDWPCRNSRLV